MVDVGDDPVALDEIVSSGHVDFDLGLVICPSAVACP